MKNLVILSLLTVIFIIGCSKEEIPVQHENDESVQLITLTGKNEKITMLEFSNIEAYEAAIAKLEAEFEKHDDAFIEQYGYLDDDALNEMEEKIGFNDQLPFIEFEKKLGFENSMRQAYVVAEKQWLNNKSLDMSNDPGNIYTFRDAEMCLLNKNGEVKIGNSILKLTPNGFIEFTDGDIDKLIRYNAGDMSILKDANVVSNITMESLKSDNCKAWKGEDNKDYYSDKKMVKMHEHFHAYPWKGTSEVQITSYKKSGSKWKKYRMSLGVANQSYFYDNDDCSAVKIQGWTGWKRKKRKSISKHFASWGAFPAYRAKNSASVIGYFEYAGHTNHDILSW